MNLPSPGDVLMRSLLGLVLGLSAFWAIGKLSLRALGLHGAGVSRAWSLALTVGAGNVLVVLEMFLFALLGLPLALGGLLAPWIGLGVWLGIRALRTPRAGPHPTPPLHRPLCAWDGVMLAVLALQVLALFATTLREPSLEGDALFWGAKAKVLFLHQGGLPSAFRDIRSFPHPEYPLFLPLTEVWIYLWMGRIDEYVMKVIFPIFYVLLLIGFYGFLVGLLGRSRALMGTVALATTPMVFLMGSTGYADLLLAFYYWLAVALFLLWAQAPRGPWLVPGAAFLGISGWIKDEGLALMALGLLWLALFRGRAEGVNGGRPRLLPYVVSVGMVLPWLLTRLVLGLPSEFHPPSTLEGWGLALSRVWPILAAFGREMFAPSSVLNSWSLAWYLLVAATVVSHRAQVHPARSLLFLVLSPLVVYGAVYMFTPYEVTWHLATSLGRVLLQVYPVALSFIVLSFGDEAKGSGTLGHSR